MSKYQASSDCCRIKNWERSKEGRREASKPMVHFLIYKICFELYCCFVHLFIKTFYFNTSCYLTFGCPPGLSSTWWNVSLSFHFASVEIGFVFFLPSRYIFRHGTNRTLTWLWCGMNTLPTLWCWEVLIRELLFNSTSRLWCLERATQYIGMGKHHQQHTFTSLTSTSMLPF